MIQLVAYWIKLISPLSANPRKVSVFGHFVGLALKELTPLLESHENI